MPPLPRTAAGLASAFVATRPPGTRAPPGDLEAPLGALFEAGRAAWPDVPLDAETLARHLGGLTTGDAALPPLAFAADVYLACACAAGAPAAAAAFDRSFSGTLAAAVARIDAAPAFVEDARQTILEHLLVAPAGARPRIGEYGGRAPLRAWLRAVALRAALNLRRARAEQPHDPIENDGPEPAASGTDPELGYLKARYKPEIEAAVRAAIGRLSPKERALLRCHLVDGMSIDALGARHGVGRSDGRPATRERAPGAARRHTRSAELAARLGLTGSRGQTALSTDRSRIEVSASGLLARSDT